MEDDEIIEDKTSLNEDDDADLEEEGDSFDSDELDFGDDSAKDKKDKDTEKDKDGKEKKSSAVIQKQKYRDKLKVALDRIKELETKKDTQGQLTDEQKKEQAANQFLADKIKEVLGDLKKQEVTSSQEEIEAFQEELDDVLEEHTDLTEKQVLDVCEELDVSPAQAVKIIEREAKLKGKEKPKLPQPRRGSPEIKKDDGKEKKSKSLDDVNRDIKKMIRDGSL